MSKKSNTQILILPGETGWEIWSSPAGGDFELQHATDLARPGELSNIPGGDLTLLFPLRSITTLPMRVMTGEEEMFEDLAQLHAERLGLRADPLAGQLSDLFEISKQEESAVLLSVWLKPPTEEDLPPVGPSYFDFSARVSPLEDDGVAVWRELGRWVFAIYQSGKLIYAQATACEGENPDNAVARELKLALMQLSLQALEVKPEHIVVWSADPARCLSALRDAFELPVEIHERPAPVLPDPISKLLPEDVRAARKEAQRRQQIQLTVMAVVALYLLLVGWLGYGLWQQSRDVEQLKQQAKAVEPEMMAYELHMKRWHELANAIDIDHYPVEILDRVSDCIPRGVGVRLASATISPQEVILNGEAPSNEAANQFRLNLRKSTSLSRFQWDCPDPRPSAVGAKFKYVGTPKDLAQAP